MTNPTDTPPASIISAQFKTTPEDFCVTEHIDFELTGEGEHLCLYIEKNGANTAYIAKQLANWADIAPRDVSYCGLKDRFAVTRQWYSLRIPKKTMPDTPFQHAEAKILSHAWHSKKLARGSHRSNQFDIILREVVAEDRQHIQDQLQHIQTSGVPNYFGAQRFGRDGKNIEKITAIFSGELAKKRVKRSEYSILLSSARAHVFNQVLAARVEAGTWNQAMTGDVFNLDGTGSIFTADIDADIRQRMDSMDIHPTAPLWGRGSLRSDDTVATLENDIASKHHLLCHGLENAGLKQERRPTRLQVQTLAWQWLDDSTLSLSFSLPKGCYATTVLSQLVQTLTSGEPTRAA